MVRLRHTSPDRKGWTRRRNGTAFSYLDHDGDRLTDPEVIDRLNALAIPPAWRDVWICPHPNGHLQAVGTDDRGRRQYLYHPQWRELRGRQKHAHVLDFARKLPAARQRVAEHLELPGMPRERALATAFRLLDLGLFRIGGETYAQENGSFGLATVRREHVRIERGTAVFEYLAKSGVHRTVSVADDGVLAVIQTLKRRRGGGRELLAWQRGRQWTDLASADINAYLKDVVDPNSSAKDFRTWHATVLAAVTLSQTAVPKSATAAKREIARAMREVSEQMGNTPAVCRASYVDPRVIDRFHEGTTIQSAVHRAHKLPTQTAVDSAIERAVLRLLDS